MDLRATTGWFFLLLGAILIMMGVFTTSTAPLTTVNVNLYTGLTMAIFGGVMLWLSKQTS
ncbi:MAG TPA: hypothetical protein VER03_07985 [Bryobacteraceae bacterium]|nr:hypothetical protein [Bryobacteraceae bacterium]